MATNYITRVILLALLLHVFATPVAVIAQDNLDDPNLASAPETREKYTAAFNATPLNRALSVLENKGLKILIKGKVQDTTPITLNSMQGDYAETILSKIIGPRDWVWYKNPQTGYYEIWDKPTYEQEVLPPLMIDKTFTLEYINAQDIVPAVQNMLNTDKGASISVDERTNKVFIRDLPEVIQQVARLIEDLDVNLTTRVFRIRHADTEEIADKLAIYKSEPGTIDPDIRTHQIFVTDIEQNIRRMELLVEVLDVGPEMRVYDLNNIGFDGDDAVDIEDVVLEVVTPDAFVQLNFRSGTLIVEDVEEVHEQIEQILAAFDPPVKQVLIEAEVLETNFENTFDYALDILFSEDLFASAADSVAGDGGSVTSPVGRPIETGSLFPDTIDQLGFTNFREQFPLVSASGGGLSLLNLSSKARIAFNAAMSDNETQVLQQPRLIVKNQEEATIEVGVEEPFANTLPSTNNNNQLFTSIQTARGGLFMSLRPSISNNGLVEIELEFENNEAIPVNIISSGDSQTAIRRNTQEIATIMVIPSGETRMIGGLLQNNRDENSQGPPLLGKIPIIGKYLFGTINNRTRQRHIMIFVTPTIIEELPQRGKVYSRPVTLAERRSFLTGVDVERELDDGPRGTLAKDYGSRRAEEDEDDSNIIDLENAATEDLDNAERNLLDDLTIEPEDGEVAPNYDDFDDEYDVFGDIGIDSNDGATTPGATTRSSASHLLAPGQLKDDAQMMNTLADPLLEAPPGGDIQTNYSTKLKGAGSTVSSSGRRATQSGVNAGGQPITGQPGQSRAPGQPGAGAPAVAGGNPAQGSAAAGNVPPPNSDDPRRVRPIPTPNPSDNNNDDTETQFN
jgi:type II secretory pathway component GspD/PulD (secretin)